jgi:para-nitrobenzyl esterase
MSEEKDPDSPTFVLDRRDVMTAGAALLANAAVSPAAAVVPVPADRSPIAQTKAGKVRGAIEDGIYLFKGVRYGATTEGRRFLPPRPPSTWSGVVDALDFGNQAPQGGSAGEIASHFSTASFSKGLHITRPESEDCLFLNVWTPGLRDGKRRPVMFYLHGGGFVYGSGASRVYDGIRLCKRGDVVVVTINHRLNVFGYLYLGDAAGPEYADSGNVGTLDTVHALKWVRDNIAEFGGDPDNITIFGQSGGGAKVSILMSSPAAKGLFHKAIVQSGSSVTPRALVTTPNKTTALANTLKVLDSLGIDGANVRDLANVPLGRLNEANVLGGGLAPTIDGRTLPRAVFDPVAPEESRAIPLMVGAAKDETTTLPYSGVLANNVMTDEQMRAALAPQLKGRDADKIVASLRALYPFAPAVEILTLASSWAHFRGEAAIQAERKAAQGGSPVFAYLFAWESPVDGGRWKAGHVFDLPFVFDNAGTLPSMVGSDTGQPQKVADAMSSAWIAFARTGNPGWPAFDANQRLTMVFNASSKLMSDPDGDERRLFNEE